MVNKVTVKYSIIKRLTYRDSVKTLLLKMLISASDSVLNPLLFVILQICSGTTDIEDSNLAVAKLKESNDIQFQELQKRMSDICEIIAFSNQTSAEGVATAGPNVSALWNFYGQKLIIPKVYIYSAGSFDWSFANGLFLENKI